MSQPSAPPSNSHPPPSPTTASPPQPSPSPPTIPPPQPTPSPSLTDLQSISTALSTFQDSFNALQLHLNTLKTTVDTLIANNSQIPILPSSNSTTPSHNIPQKPPKEENDTISIEELKTHCETMNGKALKRFLVMNLKEIDTLRREVPKALSFAPNPSKLVMECCGRFYLQGNKAYVKGSREGPRREASVLVLECFVLMDKGEDGIRIDEEVKQEADQAATLWRKRIVAEGGLLQAWRIDARGLLFLIGGFGVPQVFKDEDLIDLFRSSHVREMAGTLRRSSVLIAKAPEIIEAMIKNKLEVDAIDVIYTFGLEERFTAQTILSSVLQKIEEPSNNGKKASRGAPAVVNEANRKELALLKSLVKCLKCHKIDFSGWKVEEKISRLETDISENNKKIREENNKRKAKPGRSKFQDGKRPRHTGQWPQQEIGHNSPRHFLDTGMGGHINSYPAPQSTMHAHTHVAGTGYAAPGPYEELIVDQSGHMINHGVQPYRWHADPSITMTERAVTHGYAAQPSSLSNLYRPSALEGYAMHASGSSIGVPNRGTTSTTDLYQFTDAVVDNEYHPPVVPANHTTYPY